jgi:hypothetical protein
VVRRLGCTADNARRRRSVALGLDAGCSTLRLWLGAAVQDAAGAGIDSSGTTLRRGLDVGVHDTRDTLPLLLPTVAHELRYCVVAAPDPRHVAACGLSLVLGEAQRRRWIWAAR